MTLSKKHIYTANLQWTGNRGEGTRAYKSYDRTWDLSSPGKPVMNCSNDPLLGGDATKYNPEDLLLSSLSSCHMLWYLHLCSDAGIIVESYIDTPEGEGEMEASGKGRFISATLKPAIQISAGDLKKAEAIHSEIHEYCFIARSVNFPVKYDPVITFVN